MSTKGNLAINRGRKLEGFAVMMMMPVTGQTGQKE